ncbi:hypothetical protein NGRA_3476, partial [Nosema granulosis]
MLFIFIWLMFVKSAKISTDNGDLSFDEILDIVNDIIIRESVNSESIEPQKDIQGSDDCFIINDSNCVKQKPIEPQTLDPNNDEILDIVNDIIIRESVNSESIEPQKDIQGSDD